VERDLAFDDVGLARSELEVRDGRGDVGGNVFAVAALIHSAAARAALVGDVDVSHQRSARVDRAPDGDVNDAARRENSDELLPVRVDVVDALGRELQV